MNPLTALKIPAATETEAPVMGKLATQLIDQLKADPSMSEAERQEFINQMLNYASAAEQLINDQKRRIDYLESLSSTDELTGLLNRRGFDEVLRRTLSSARRHHEVGMLAYIDLNDFKMINDTYGHHAGDLALRKIADTLEAQTRRTDFIARIGGDEFAILFVRAEQIPTRARAVKLKQVIDETTIHVDGIDIPLSASFGLEPYGPTSTSKDLLRRADRAMYKEKNKVRSE